MHLTQRELSVINAIVNGNTAAKKIADVLEIKRRTVETHLYRIRQKTGVRKAGLPRWAITNLPGGSE